MANIVQRVDYYYTEVPNRAGVGAKVLNALKAGGCQSVCVQWFPVKRTACSTSLRAVRPGCPRCGSAERRDQAGWAKDCFSDSGPGSGGRCR